MVMICTKCDRYVMTDYNNGYITFSHNGITVKHSRKELIEADSILVWQEKCIQEVLKLSHDELYQEMRQALDH